MRSAKDVPMKRKEMGPMEMPKIYVDGREVTCEDLGWREERIRECKEALQCLAELNSNEEALSSIDPLEDEELFMDMYSFEALRAAIDACDEEIGYSRCCVDWDEEGHIFVDCHPDESADVAKAYEQCIKEKYSKYIKELKTTIERLENWED